jgi:hypothetical protein
VEVGYVKLLGVVAVLGLLFALSDTPFVEWLVGSVIIPAIVAIVVSAFLNRP